ncbi:MAG: lipoprotein-releasing system transmembrane subunit LolC [Gammaproteobacteria bacterium]|nr:MAG: lipoprotein-releasing system transmembrane subunit LolC [Gammaproteobacteria bacterium]
MSLSLFIGKRYVTATRGRGFVSVFSIISVVGITLGIMALIVVMSVMNGVTGEVRDKILSMTAHTKIVSTNNIGLAKDTDISPFIKNEKEVLASAPFIEGQALIGIGQSYNGVQVKGVDPNTEASVADALADMDDTLKTLTEGSFNVMIGQNLANQLGVGVGDKITVVVPKTTATAAGIVPRIKRFKVSAIFHSGHYLYDTGLILININDAEKLFQRGDHIDGFQLKLDDLFKAQGLVERLDEKLPSSMYAFDWTQQNKAYFDAVKTEKAAMFVILMIIVFVATFNILSTLVMAVTNKQSDIAILRTIGITPGAVMRIFIVQGMTLSVIGTLIGIIGGVLFAMQVPDMMAYLENHFGLRLPAELYFISALHPKIDAVFIAWVAFLSLLLSFLITLYPAYKAAKVQPARALAYE